MNEQQLLSEIKRLEGVYLQPQTFKQYKNYWLPEKIVKESKNVLSLGVHRDVGWEQSMLKDNSICVSGYFFFGAYTFPSI